MPQSVDPHPLRADALFLAWIRSKGWDPAVLSDLQLRSLNIGYEAELSAGPINIAGTGLKLRGVTPTCGNLKS